MAAGVSAAAGGMNLAGRGIGAPPVPGLAGGSASPGGASSPSAVILHAMRLNWEPLQLRFWPVAIADALLGLIDGNKRVVLTEDPCLQPFVVLTGLAGGAGVGAGAGAGSFGAGRRGQMNGFSGEADGPCRCHEDLCRSLEFFVVCLSARVDRALFTGFV